MPKRLAPKSQGRRYKMSHAGTNLNPLTRPTNQETGTRLATCAAQCKSGIWSTIKFHDCQFANAPVLSGIVFESLLTDLMLTHTASMSWEAKSWRPLNSPRESRSGTNPGRILPETSVETRHPTGAKTPILTVAHRASVLRRNGPDRSCPV